MKKALLLITACIICEITFAQQDTTAKPATDTSKNAAATKPAKKFSLKKTSRQAGRKLKAGDVYGATDLFEDILKNKPEEYKLAYQMAQTYYVCRDYEKAEKWFKYVLDKDAPHYPEARYWYAIMLKMNSKYIDAKEQFNTFIKEYNGTNLALKKWAKVDADGCDLAPKLKADPDKINLIHLDSKVNSAYSDISPIMWDDSTLLYGSLRSDTVIVIDTSGGATPPEHLIKFYIAKKHDTGYEQAQKFDKFDVPGSHLANGAFSPDHKRFYFTICQDISYEQVHCDIYVSEYVDDQWQPADPLGSEVNDIRFTSTQPSVGTYKGNQDVLYFASDRPGGKGGLDIWYSVIAKGKYSQAKNAGKINTDRNDATPYYDNSTGTLYFSSQGWPGLGGYDVFKAIGKLNKWTDPENMGVPINSSADDMYFRYNKTQNSGFVVSNRVGIISLKSKTCCDDIFAFDSYSKVNIAVRGYVYDEALPDYPLNGADVTLSLRGYGGLNEDIMVNQATTADDKRYFFNLNPDASYKVTGSKDTYLSSSVNFDTKGITKSDTLQVNIFLKRLIKNKAYTLKNIYYDFNKADIKPESKPTLDSLYTIMTENPSIIVELGSHTDSRGSETYNNVLSQKRAESCVAYLIAKGIPKERITAVGYGKSEPLEDCSKYPECPATADGDCPCYQKNRRTEFKIIGETAPVNYDDQTFKKSNKEE